MGDNNNGIWVLFMYSVAFIVFIEVILNLVIADFTQNDLPVNSETAKQLLIFQTVANGTAFNSLNLDLGLFTIPIGDTMNFIYTLVMPDALIDFVIGQMNLFSYIPLFLQIPILVLLIASFGIVIYTLATMLIP